MIAAARLRCVHCLQVALSDLHARMAHEQRKLVDMAAIQEVLHGEGVPEGVGAHTYISDARRLLELLDQLCQAMDGQRFTRPAYKHMLLALGILGMPVACDIAPERYAACPAQWHFSFLPAFADNSDIGIVCIEPRVFEHESTQFGGADPRIDQQRKNSLVPYREGLLVERAKQGLQLFRGEYLDDGL